MIFQKRILLAFLIIVILVPQTPRENKLIFTFNESGLFSNYFAASQTVQIVTVFTIVLFFMTLFI
uniref:Hypothetical chloroplast RF47 n=1 Tax=Codium simulans TaxID=589376 RepID=A0A1I9LKH6_9CHLO|nr:hypothetical chloroplast RF47 [Codium simulans]ANJ70837.1 hypothetical chloroplast RF47 [Codium simulans]